MVVSGYLFFLTLAEPWPVSTSGSIWDAFAAIGTVAATGVAVLLAWRAARQDKGAVARVVSAWVTDEYFPDDRMTSYQRRVTLHVANESNEPVYEARLNVFAGRDRRPLGPLAAPSVISVVPPRRKLDYDITLPLASHVGTEDPRAELHFTDPAGHRWRRDVLGALEALIGRPCRPRRIQRRRGHQIRETLWASSSRLSLGWAHPHWTLPNLLRS